MKSGLTLVFLGYVEGLFSVLVQKEKFEVKLEVRVRGEGRMGMGMFEG